MVNMKNSTLKKYKIQNYTANQTEREKVIYIKMTKNNTENDQR